MSIRLDQVQKIVLKLGSQIVLDSTGVGVDKQRLGKLSQSIQRAVQSKKSLIIVTSGAIGLGRRLLGLSGDLTTTQRQACAAVGQNQLMNMYSLIFEPLGLKTAQVLLTSMDLSRREHYLNLQGLMDELLAMNVIPIINENDSVSTFELQENADRSFGDNDKLSALLAAKVDADLLILLTDVDGLYDKNPKQHPDAVRIQFVRDFASIKGINTEGKSKEGRGGMSSKVEAARIASISGVTTLITSGADFDLDHLLRTAGEVQMGYPGTFVLGEKKISKRKQWIGFSSGFEGVVVINEGACQALQKKKSLLAVGVIEVLGDFREGAVVSIQDYQGSEIGRGLIRVSSATAQKIKGLRSEVIPQRLAEEVPEELIHRDDLVLFEESL